MDKPPATTNFFAHKQSNLPHIQSLCSTIVDYFHSDYKSLNVNKTNLFDNLGLRNEFYLSQGLYISWICLLPVLLFIFTALLIIFIRNQCVKYGIFNKYKRGNKISINTFIVVIVVVMSSYITCCWMMKEMTSENFWSIKEVHHTSWRLRTNTQLQQNIVFLEDAEKEFHIYSAQLWRVERESHRIVYVDQANMVEQKKKFIEMIHVPIDKIVQHIQHAKRYYEEIESSISDADWTLIRFQNSYVFRDMEGMVEMTTMIFMLTTIFAVVWIIFYLFVALIFAFYRKTHVDDPSNRCLLSRRIGNLIVFGSFSVLLLTTIFVYNSIIQHQKVKSLATITSSMKASNSSNNVSTTTDSEQPLLNYGLFSTLDEEIKKIVQNFESTSSGGKSKNVNLEAKLNIGKHMFARYSNLMQRSLEKDAVKVSSYTRIVDVLDRERGVESFKLVMSVFFVFLTLFSSYLILYASEWMMGPKKIEKTEKSNEVKDSDPLII